MGWLWASLCASIKWCLKENLMQDFLVDSTSEKGVEKDGEIRGEKKQKMMKVHKIKYEKKVHQIR